MANVKTSMYADRRCYLYNKAFARFYDNYDQYGGNTLSGAMGERSTQKTLNKADLPKSSQFDLIREWASERGLYDKGDPKTQALKLVEEVGEICRAVLKDDIDEVIDGIGDAVVVLTNLAELHDVSIEECIASAYDVISKRTGKMVNGTFVKDAK